MQYSYLTLELHICPLTTSTTCSMTHKIQNKQTMCLSFYLYLFHYFTWSDSYLMLLMFYYFYWIVMNLIPSLHAFLRNHDSSAATILTSSYHIPSSDVLRHSLPLFYSALPILHPFICLNASFAVFARVTPSPVLTFLCSELHSERLWPRSWSL